MRVNLLTTTSNSGAAGSQTSLMWFGLRWLSTSYRHNAPDGGVQAQTAIKLPAKALMYDPQLFIEKGVNGRRAKETTGILAWMGNCWEKPDPRRLTSFLLEVHVLLTFEPQPGRPNRLSDVPVEQSSGYFQHAFRHQ